MLCKCHRGDSAAWRLRLRLTLVTMGMGHGAWPWTVDRGPSVRRPYRCGDRPVRTRTAASGYNMYYVYLE